MSMKLFRFGRTSGAVLALVLGLTLAVPAAQSAAPAQAPAAQAPAAAPATAGLPARLTDREFWDLTEMVSEPNGDFQSDNFLSNERGYQVIIPELIATAKSGRV